MSIIVEKKEASTYGLLKLWIILTSITLFPIIQLSSNSKIDFFYTSMYALSAISILVHEGWERLLPIRFLYIENVRGEKIKNKNLIELFSNKKLFWFRELSGNITKSTVNCWISFVILAMLIAKIKNNSFCYEGKTIVFDNYLNISSAFYIAASEIFFSGSGIFPCHSLSKVAFFSMHIYGLFLYGVFFAIGIQAFSFKNYPGDK